MLAFLAYPALWTRGPRRWRWTLGLLAVATGAELLYAAVLAVHQLGELPLVASLDRLATSNPAILAGSDRLYLGGYTTLPRLRGTMCEPLYLGSYLVAVIPLLALRERRWLPWLAGGALLLTWSRAAWAAAAGGLALWWLLRRRARLPGPPRRVWLAAASAAAAALVLVMLVAGPDALLWPARRVAQTLDGGDWSNLTRYYSFQAAWRCFLSSPVVGVGWGQFPYHFYALVDVPGLESQFTWPVVNSVPLLVLAETGVVGLAVVVAAVVAVGRGTWRILARLDDRRRAARLAALAAAGGGLGLQLLVFSQYNLPHLWVVPGLWLAALAEEVRRP
jgi:O-antigen ligase